MYLGYALLKDLTARPGGMPGRTLEVVTTCQKSIPSMKGSKSLRATVPQVVVQCLRVEHGDRIRWTLDPVTGHVSIRKERG